MNFKTINFGKADAHTEGEAYPELLSNGYLNISSVAEKALNGNVFLFLGYKGSGKTSRVTFKYRNRSSSFNPEDRIRLHKGLWKALNVNY